MNDTFIGTTIAKKITVNILNPNNEINLEDKTISVETGIMIDGIEEKVPFGNFIIPKPDNEEVKTKTSFVGYDYMIKFNELYKDRVTYPCAAKILFQDICNQVGIEAGNLNFINADFIIKGNPFDEETQCKTVLSKIAELAGGFVHIGRDNKAYITTPKNITNVLLVEDIHNMKVEELNKTKVKLLSSGTKEKADYRLNGNNYQENFVKNNIWGKVNSISIVLSDVKGEYTTRQDEADIASEGLTEIVIEDNPFLATQEDRESVITALWEHYKDFEYLPFKVDYYGYPYTDSGDSIYIYDTKDNRYVSCIFNHTFTFNGGYSGNIETQALSKTQYQYKNNINTKKKIKKVELSVDKMNGKITSEVARINDELEETNSKIEQTDTQIRIEVSKKVDSSEIISKINQSAEEIQINANKLSLERKGYKFDRRQYYN